MLVFLLLHIKNLGQSFKWIAWSESIYSKYLCILTDFETRQDEYVPGEPLVLPKIINMDHAGTVCPPVLYHRPESSLGQQMVTWMVNVMHWVMRLVHSRSKSHINLTPAAFLPRTPSPSAPALPLSCWSQSWGGARASWLQLSYVLCSRRRRTQVYLSGTSCLGYTDFGPCKKALKQSSAVNFMITHDSNLKCQHLPDFLSFNIYVISSTLFLGWSQSDHGDQSVAETRKLMVHACENRPWART